jgi:hypothetical protein
MVLQKLNWRLVLLHFMAGCFLMHALSILFYVSSPSMIKQLSMIVGNSDAFKKYVVADNGNRYVELMAFDYYASLAFLVGLLVSFITSLIISMRKKQLWVNSLIVFALHILLLRYEDEQKLRWRIVGVSKFLYYPTVYLSLLGFGLLFLAFFFFFKSSRLSVGRRTRVS